MQGGVREGAGRDVCLEGEAGCREVCGRDGGLGGEAGCREVSGRGWDGRRIEAGYQ